MPADIPGKITEPDPDAVVVAYVHSNNITYSWHHSMIELIGWDLTRHGRIVRGGYLAIRYGTDGITLARNKAVLDFMVEKAAGWLFWTDTDMGFPPDVVDRLLEAADPVERPIVGALTFAQREEQPDGMGGFRCLASPSIFDWADTGQQQGFAIRWDYTPNSLTQVGATGSACILIHRSVFEKIEAAYGRAWYDRVPNTTTGQVLSEDLAFCLRAGALGIPVFVHTGIRTTHHKAFWLAEDDYYAQRALAQLTPQVPPATERTAVIVPTMRPGNAATFMHSLTDSNIADLATVYAVVDEGDAETAIAWRDLGANVLVGARRTFAEKCNYAYGLTDEPWLLLVGDDVAFHPGWLDQAQAVGRVTGAHVIGTNDMHNPRVVRGEHATHPMIRRSYIAERGASWDGPGVVCHEYGHWFVDDEIVTVAKQRKVWAAAAHAKVEHLHPFWGLADDDEVYRLGQDKVDADRAEFEARILEHLGEPAGATR